MRYTLSQRLAHFFHVVSNIRPVVWIGLYLCAAPIFGLIYWALPDCQFRLPDDTSPAYGTWLYYSIVTITTLGFGDITPIHGAAQAVTAVEVACGLIFLGLFLNAVGAMKSEIDIESEIEKQKALHRAMETQKLRKSAPMILNTLNSFLSYCYAVTTPLKDRSEEDIKFNAEFSINDMADLFRPSGLSIDGTSLPAVERLMHSATHSSLALDSLQQRIDLSLWPKLLSDCFTFVANYQMFANTDLMFRNPDKIILTEATDNELAAEDKLAKKIAAWNSDDRESLDPDLKAIVELYDFIHENAKLATGIETFLTDLVLKDIDNL